MKYLFSLARVATIKKTITRVDKDIEKLELSYVDGRNVEQCSHSGK